MKLRLFDLAKSRLSERDLAVKEKQEVSEWLLLSKRHPTFSLRYSMRSVKGYFTVLPGGSTVGGQTVKSLSVFVKKILDLLEGREFVDRVDM